MSTGDSEGVNRFLFNLKNGNDDDHAPLTSTNVSDLI